MCTEAEPYTYHQLATLVTDTNFKSYHSHFKCLFSMLAWATVGGFLNGHLPLSSILCQITINLQRT